MNQPVKLSDIVDAMEMASEEMADYLDRTTGKVVTITGDALAALEDGEEPFDMADWQRKDYEIACLIAADETGRFVALPSSFDIDEYRMMQKFTRRVDASAADELSRAISGSGAFRYFKDTVHRLGLADAWYRYRDAAYAEAARDWCELKGIAYVDKGGD